MGLHGSLRDMAVADLIQHNCQERKTALLRVQQNGHTARIFFHAGSVTHADLDGQVGEEIVYRVLGWEDGNFSLEEAGEAPQQTIHRSWSSLIMEGARLLDERKTGTVNQQSWNSIRTETNQMAQKLNEILNEMSTEVTGFSSSIVAGMDGLNIAQHTTNKVDPELISAQLTLLVKLVDTSADKLKAGGLEDELLTTDQSFILMRFLPGKQYFLGIAADRRTANLGNLRLMSRIYADRLSKAMPR